MGLTGDLTVAEAKGLGEELITEIVETTRLSRELVHRRLNRAPRKDQIRSLFVDEWPDLAGELAKQTVASAKANDLGGMIAGVTKLDHRTVQFVLDQTSGRTHVPNAFEFAWPGKVDSARRGELIRELLSNQTVATIRQYDLFAELASILGLEEQDVRNTLSAHRGHKLLRNIPANTSVVTTGPALAEDDAESDEEDERKMLSFIPEDGTAIGNGNLRDRLGWDEDKYSPVRARLLEKGSIWLGKGRGGSVVLASGWRKSRKSELFALVPEDGTAVSNATLTGKLGWEEPFYVQIKEQLVEEGLLQIGKGRGGTVFRSRSPSLPVSPVSNRTVAPSPVITASPIKLFFCYSHKDEALREELEAHLTSLRRERLISPWHDRRIGAGQEWKGAIEEHLKSADLVLLLVSHNFIASEYCWDDEMTCALDRCARGETMVIPIILSSSDWNTAPFARLQVLPKDAKPITLWSDRNEAWLDVVRGIRAAVLKLVARAGQ
jgi:hypothetical protein